jgi:peptidoglycan/LPS O-acetylase OafA/YrhL
MGAERRGDYYPHFDWLRAVLACIVMAGHGGLLAWPRAGNLAVQVFFALSGWLIGGILLRTDLRHLPRFYFNRAVRIWVPYYLALAALVGASLLRDPVTPKWVEFVCDKITFVYNIFGPPQLEQFRNQMPLLGTGNHFWSVNAEEQFYLLAPLPLVLLASRWSRSVALWLGLAVIAWTTGVYPSIVLGVLAAVLARRLGASEVPTRWRLVALASAAVSGAALAAGWDYDRTSPVLAISAVLALAAKGHQGRLGEVAGGMSYPLYLNHWVGGFVASAIFGRYGLKESEWRHAFSFAFNVALAVGLYWLVDRRLLAVRPRLYSHRLGISAIALGYGGVVVGLVLAYGVFGFRGVPTP